MKFKFKTLLSFALLGAVAQAVSQNHLIVDNATSEVYFSPMMPMNLSTIVSEQSFTALSHPRFPHHGVRIKKSTFCDPTVSVYTGYLDVDQGAKYLFFYLDDVMMWINGGPAPLSPQTRTHELTHSGTRMHLFPRPISYFSITHESTSSCDHREEGFHDDRGVGVGYSYADFGEIVETTKEAARNVHAFLTIFFETFKQFAGRSFHLSGESYAGRYLPVLASEIYGQNVVAEAEGRAVINFQSVLIGNGITDFSTGVSTLDVPFQSISNCVKIKLPKCQEVMHKYCIDQFDHIGCGSTVESCDKHIRGPYYDSGRNVYDVCESQDLCYPEEAAIAEFLNYPGTRAMLRAESPGNFSFCSDAVPRNFVSHLDKWSHHTQDYVAALLERGIRVLIHAGTYDWQCNWVANKLWVDKLDWAGNEAYKKQVWIRSWLVNGNAAGETKTSAIHYLTHDSSPL